MADAIPTILPPSRPAASPWAGAGVFGALVGIGLVYLWMLAIKPLIAAPVMGYDDMLFVRLAEHVLAGQWLGPYDHLTLAKGPGYPLFLAANAWLGLPLQLGQGVIYLIAGWILAFNLRRLGAPGWACILLFAIYLFVPGATATLAERVLREGLYMPLVALLFAAMVWQLAWRHRRFGWRVLPALLLGGTAFWLWITREETLWLLPGLAIFGLGMILANLSTPQGGRFGRFADDIGVGLVVAVCIVGGVLGIGAINQRHYYVNDTAELRQKAQLAAYGALARVLPERYVPRVIAPKDVRDKIYAVSPSFALLRPYLEGSALIWSRWPCEANNIVPCDNNYRTSHFIWALRDAAASAGFFKSADMAKSFFKVVAREVNSACDDGRLKCGQLRTTWVPPYRPEYLDPALRAFVRIVLEGLRQQNLPSGPTYWIGDTIDIERFRRVVQTPLYARGPHELFVLRVTGATDRPLAWTLDAPAGRGNMLRVENFPPRGDGARDARLETDCTDPQCRLVVRDGDEIKLRIGTGELTAGRNFEAGELKIAVLSRDVAAVDGGIGRQVRVYGVVRGALTQAYAMVLPYAALAGGVLYLFSLLRAMWRRRVPPLLVLSSVALTYALTRAAMLAYFEAAWFPADLYFYLSPFYPMSVLFTGLALIGGAQDLAHAMRGPPAAEAATEATPSTAYVPTAIEREKM